MAILHIRGRLVVESAGPIWHLSGMVKRDRSRLKRLMLIRTADLLSPRIKAALGQTLSAVQITDRAGRSAKLINARINDGRPFEQLFGSSRHSSSSTTTSDQQEEFHITFTKITYLWGGISPSDDWASPA
jgi:hypothetical protein